jgi:V/A-type H+-transporting ATPase subunit D
MADKILMNKNSLATLKTELGEYRDALPVFEMKEQQLKGLVQSIEEGISLLKEDIKKNYEQVKSWGAVMSEEGVGLAHFAQVDQIASEQQEIVGVTVEHFVDLKFEAIEIDYFTTPLWVDAAIEVIKDQKIKNTILDFEQKKLALLQEELAEARRMKNALKEVFIPETKELIRKIEIYLGDVERLAIGCAKLVKKKKLEKKMTA